MNALPAPRPKTCRHGEMIYLKNDIYVGRSLDLYGEFSELESQLFAQIVRPNMVVVEIGANIGAHTLGLARMVQPHGRVLAFEPQRIVFQILCANLALNGLFNVDARQIAVGAAAGTLSVPPLDYAGLGNFGGVSLTGAGAGEPVAVTTLDALALPAAHVLKIDVEGMEAEVLKGAADTIARCRPILYVENDRREKSPDLIRALKSLKYRLWWHTPPLFNPDNFQRQPENVFGRIVSINLLCVPAELSWVLNGFAEVADEDDWFDKPR